MTTAHFFLLCECAYYVLKLLSPANFPSCILFLPVYDGWTRQTCLRRLLSTWVWMRVGMNMKGSEGESVCVFRMLLSECKSLCTTSGGCATTAVTVRAFCCKVNGALPPISLFLAALQDLLSVTRGCQLLLMMLTRHHCQGEEYKAANTCWHKLACTCTAKHVGQHCSLMRIHVHMHIHAMRNTWVVICGSHLLYYCEDTLWDYI